MKREDLDFVPFSFSVSNNCTSITVVRDASHVLFDILNNVALEGMYNFCVNNSSVPLLCVTIPKLHLTALYLDTNTPVTGFNAGLRLRLSRIQFGVNLAPYGMVTEAEVLKYAMYYDRDMSRKYGPGTKPGPIVSSWLAGLAKPPVHKISAQHLRHVTVDELTALAPDVLYGKCYYLWPLLERLAKRGMHESMFVGILLWAAMLPKDAHKLSSESAIWSWKYESVLDFAEQVKKKFSLRMKALQNIVSVDLTPFFELEVLVNRGLGEVDWAQERDHRVNPVTCTVAPEIVRAKAKALFSKMKGRGAKHHKLDWEKFWDLRWNWAPTGSFHSQYVADMKYKSHSRHMRNKMFSSCAMGRRAFSHFAEREPQMYAWSSTKYEWGKQRAIYGVDYTNFTMTQFALPNIEEVLSTVFPIGSAATADNVSAVVKQVLRNGLPYCFDFADFNSQHSNDSMQALLDAYMDVFAAHMSEEQKVALLWVRDAISEAYVIQPDGSEYKTMGTLLSGWRLTTVMNTMLNQIYTDICLDGRQIVSTHNGDDILASIQTYRDVQTLERGAHTIGVRFQRSKCFLASIAEFLRVDHYGEVGSQYLARGVSTLVHGPTEMSLPTDLAAVLKSHKTRIDEVTSRGGDLEVVRQVTNQILKRVSQHWGVGMNTLLWVLGTHYSLGGSSDVINERTLMYKIEKDAEVTEVDEKVEKDMQVPTPGTHDIARRLCSTIVESQYLEKIQRSARKALFAKATNIKFRLKFTKVNPDNKVLVTAHAYGMYRNNEYNAKAVLAKAYGVPIQAILITDTWLTRRLMEEKDQMRAIGVLF